MKSHPSRPHQPRPTGPPGRRGQNSDSLAVAVALFGSLVRGPLLVGDLPEAASFSYSDLTIPESPPPLNLDQKLGQLYEDALAVLLEASPQFDLLAKNLQLRTDVHTTVGELDFLIRNLGTGQLIHLELATKFYLAVEGACGLLLPGPDARDNYFKKLQRLREHQLVLVQNYREALPESCRDEEIVTRQLVYGCLFDHIHAHAPAAPDFIHPDGRRGRWFSVDECAACFPADTRFQVIPKPLWPVPLSLLDEFSLESWTPEAKVDRYVMLRVDDQPAPYFVAPSGYPNHAGTRP